MEKTQYILILYYSLHGSVKALAREIASGVESTGMESRVRRVPSLQRETDDSTPVCSNDDIAHAAGLALGSPTRFGNMSAAVKQFLDGTGELWMKKQLAGKPCSVFTSSNSLHGGQESTLLSMMLPLLHHGMIVVGLEYDATLRLTTTGGGPYGVSHWAYKETVALSKEERLLCHRHGARLANIAQALL